jgi:CIC family chloride channel protein
MISNLVSFFISSQMQRKPIYEVLAEQDGIHLPGLESRSQDGHHRVARAMKPALETLEAGCTAQQALKRVGSSQFQGWPVLNARRLQGVITRTALQKAVADDSADDKLGDLVDPISFPHLHVDHPRSVALERMGATQLDVLPVVSRADVHKLEGVVALKDVLDSYGFGPSGRD